jgi:acetyltransferase-like isoleucine patch superfamily enzyme
VKTGLGLYSKYRILYAYFNLVRFWSKNKLLGFDVANQFLCRVDKISIKLILKRNGAEIGENCDIETGLIFHNCKDYSNLVIGKNCHIGKNCFFDLRDKVIIGNNVVISMQCTFITHIDMSKSDLSIKFKLKQNKIIVNDNCYIGANCTILKGVILGRNSFIGAKSLVTKDVSNNTMVGGIPATLLKNI